MDFCDMYKEDNLLVKNNFQKQLTLPFYFLLIVFWVAQIWAPIDIFVTGGEQNILQRFFESDLLLRKLTPFEIIVILISVFLLVKFGHSYVSNKFQLRFFVFTLVVVFIGFINPNNDRALYSYFGNKNIRIFYLYLLFLYSITLLQKDIYIVVIRKFFYIGSVIAFSKAAYSFMLFLLNKGMVWQGRNVTIAQGDSLTWMGIFHVVFLALYFDMKKKKYLLISLLFFLVTFFSFRRSGVFLCMAVDSILIMYFITCTKGFARRVKQILVSTIVLFSIFFLVARILPRDRLSDYFYRYTGAFSYFMNRSSSHSDYTDSGHMLQSILTTRYFFKNVKNHFWGKGFSSQEVMDVEGQTINYVDGVAVRYIHNSYVQVWVFHGLHMTIYFVIILILMFYQSLKIWKIKRKPIYCKSAIIFFLTGFFIIDWFTGRSFIRFPQYITQFVLLFSVLKIDFESIDYLFSSLRNGKRTLAFRRRL